MLNNTGDSQDPCSKHRYICVVSEVHSPNLRTTILSINNAPFHPTNYRLTLHASKADIIAAKSTQLQASSRYKITATVSTLC